MTWELDAFLAVLDSIEGSTADCEISAKEWQRFKMLMRDWLYRAN